MTAIIFAVFAVVCVVAFLTYRGSDIGQLPKLIGNLGGGPLLGSGITDSLVGLIVALLIGICWCGLGLSASTSDGEKRSQILDFVMRVGVGVAIWSLLWFFFGLMGGYSTFAAITFLGCNVIFAIGNRRIRLPLFRNAEISSMGRLNISLLFLIVLITIVAFVSSVAPPTAKDTLLYHFAVPKAFVEQQSNAFIDGNIASYLALGTEMQSVWAMLLGNIVSLRAGEAAAGATIFLFFPLLLMAVYGWAREIGISATWSLIATLLVATVPSAYHVASSGYIDLSLALYVTLALYSLMRWWKEQTWGWVILIGIFLGAALSVKLTTVFVFAAFALVILIRARDNTDTQAGSLRSGGVVASGFAALLLAGVIASPWYLRTWVATGSPVFPFYMSIWPGKANGWDVERSNLFQGMNSQYGGIDTDKINYLTAPVRLSVVAQPEQPANYDGVLGVAFLIGLPLLVWALWKFDLAVEIKIMAGIAGIMYLFWLFSSEQLRYFLPIAPLLAIAIVASAEKIGNGVGKVARCALIAASVCGLLTSFAWFCQKAPLRVVLGGETRDQYLTRNLDYYPYYQAINTETPADSKVWLINMRRDTYNIERPIFSDYLFESWTFRNLVWESHDVNELRTKIRSMGIDYILVNKTTLISELQPISVRDEDWKQERTNKERMANELLLDRSRTIKADNKFSLIKVF